MNISWQSVSSEFEPDGSLCDIYISSVTPADWQSVIDFIRQEACDVSYSIDGHSSSLPSAVNEALSARKYASPLLTFRFGSIPFASHFFNDNEVEFDFTPNDICGQSEFDTLCEFIRRIGDLVSKPVSIAPENCREYAFIFYMPDTHEFSYRPEFKHS